MTSAEQKRLSPILRAVAETDLNGLGLVARYELDRLRRRAPAKPLPGKSRAEVRREKRAERAEVSAAIRAAVMERCGGVCEVCGAAIATDAHHLLGGSGRRTQQQSPESVVGACAFCHRRLHAHPLENKALRAQRAAAAAQIQVMADLAALLDPTAKRTP